jgi:hypothetical protein
MARLKTPAASGMRRAMAVRPVTTWLSSRVRQVVLARNVLGMWIANAIKLATKM